MHFSEREVRGVTILDLQGQFAMGSELDRFSERMNWLIRGGHSQILLNFDGVTYLDSAGVGAIAWQWVTARKRDAAVKLSGLHAGTHTVLKGTRLLNVLEHFDSEVAALASFHSETDGGIHPIFT